MFRGIRIWDDCTKLLNAVIVICLHLLPRLCTDDKRDGFVAVSHAALWRPGEYKQIGMGGANKQDVWDCQAGLFGARGDGFGIKHERGGKWS